MSLLVLDDAVWLLIAPLLDSSSLIRLFLAGSTLNLKLKRVVRDFSFEWFHGDFIPLKLLVRAMRLFTESPQSLAVWHPHKSLSLMAYEPYLPQWAASGVAHLKHLRLDFGPLYFQGKFCNFEAYFPSLTHLKLPCASSRQVLTLPRTLEHLEFGAKVRGLSSQQGATVMLPFYNMPPGLRTLIMPFEIRFAGDPLDFQEEQSFSPKIAASSSKLRFTPIDWRHLPLETLEASFFNGLLSYETLPPTLTSLNVQLWSSGLNKLLGPPRSWEALFPNLISLSAQCASLSEEVEKGKWFAPPLPLTLTSLAYNILPSPRSPDLRNAALLVQIARIGPKLRSLNNILGITSCPSELATICPNLTHHVPTAQGREILTQVIPFRTELLATHGAILDLISILPLPNHITRLECFVSEPHFAIPSADNWPQTLTILEFCILYHPTVPTTQFDLNRLPTTLIELNLIILMPQASVARCTAQELTDNVIGGFSHMLRLRKLSIDVIASRSLKIERSIISSASQLPKSLTVLQRFAKESISDSVFLQAREALPNLTRLRLCRPLLPGSQLDGPMDEQAIDIANLMNLPSQLRSLHFRMKQGGAPIRKRFITALPKTLETLQIGNVLKDGWKRTSCFKQLPKTLVKLDFIFCPPLTSRKPGATGKQLSFDDIPNSVLYVKFGPLELSSSPERNAFWIAKRDRYLERWQDPSPDDPTSS